MGEGDVPVRNVVEKVDFLLFEQEGSAKRVDWSITPSLVEETTSPVEILEVISISRRPQPVKRTDFKVTPEMAVVIILPIVIRDKLQAVAFNNVMWVLGHELLGGFPESWNGFLVFVQTEGKAVFLLVLFHVEEWIVVDVAEELDGGFDTPVKFIVGEEFVFEEETRFESTHVAVGDGITIDDFSLSHVLTNSGSFVLINPFGEAPVFLWNKAILGLSADKTGGDLLELFVERLVIKENPIVIIFTVESVLDVTDRFSDFPGVAVTC